MSNGHYTLDNIKEKHADYNLIIGERSNGKTTAVLWEGLQRYIDSGYSKQLAVIRRWEEDFKGKNGSQMFDGIVSLKWIEKKTNNKYNAVQYWSKRWYLCKFDKSGNKVESDENPFALGFAISSEEHYKSTSYPNIDTILFDEFITRGYYLPDEFVKFQSLLSTIIRLRDNVVIYMCGNTVNKYCPYFSEMGLTNIKTMKQGSIDVYEYGESNLRVAVEYSDFKGKKKASNKYFAFDNPKLKMITNGNWEIDIYPHLPCKYKPKDILYIYYIEFNGDVLQCNIINVDGNVFTYIHRKTTMIKNDTKRLVYSCVPSFEFNRRTHITHPIKNVDSKILKFYKDNKVFYQDNEVGEIVSNYIKWCKTNPSI